MAEFALKGLVHDLNNVFETIAEAAELLSTDPQWAPLAATIKRSVERGRRLTSGVKESAATQLEFSAILAGAITFTRDFLEAGDRHVPYFQCNVEPEMRIPGNPVEWERVLVNLFLNAAEAMNRPGIISVNARRSEGGCIEVSDNGPGIPPQILDQIFQPHFSTNVLHSGLGLHIVQSLVAANGGEVTAENKPDGGALFRISITGK